MSPSISGMCMSRTTTSNASPAAVARATASRAAGPPSASSTAAPLPASWRSTICRFVALSSTTSTRRPSRAPGAGAGGGGAAEGPTRTENENVEPSPGTLSTETAPPMSSASRFEIARPRPVPPYRRVVELSACVKASNRRA